MAMPAQLKQIGLSMGYASADQLGEALRNGTVSMNEFMVAGDMDDEVKFTCDYYRDIASTATGTPYNREENYTWQDVNGTSDFVCVITITTAGSIIISVTD